MHSEKEDSRFNHGTVDYPRPLSDKELADWQLSPVETTPAFSLESQQVKTPPVAAEEGVGGYSEETMVLPGMPPPVLPAGPIATTGGGLEGTGLGGAAEEVAAETAQSEAPQGDMFDGPPVIEVEEEEADTPVAEVAPPAAPIKVKGVWRNNLLNALQSQSSLVLSSTNDAPWDPALGGIHIIENKNAIKAARDLDKMGLARVSLASEELPGRPGIIVRPVAGRSRPTCDTGRPRD